MGGLPLDSRPVIFYEPSSLRAPFMSSSRFATARSLVRRRRGFTRSDVLLLLASAVCSLAILEAVLALPFLATRYRLFFRLPPIDANDLPQQAAEFVVSSRFDPSLGWDQQPPAGDQIHVTQAVGQAYGDSFTRAGHESRTWQDFFEDLTGQSILNYGVGGFSLVQAVLKFERYATASPTRFAILGIYSEMHRRNSSYHARYFFQDTSPRWQLAFRPLALLHEGRLRVILPPCSDAACLVELLSNPRHRAHRMRSRYDIWYQIDLRRPKLVFPRVIAFARALPGIWQARRQRHVPLPPFVSPEALEVSRLLVRRFVDRAEQLGMIPVCLLFYSPRELSAIRRGQRLDAEFVRFLTQERIRFIDTAAYILARVHDDAGLAGLAVADGHLNDRGDRLVAHAIKDGLGDIES